MAELAVIPIFQILFVSYLNILLFRIIFSNKTGGITNHTFTIFQLIIFIYFCHHLAYSWSFSLLTL